MKPSKSPYSKMYLVTPGVYDKLLSCLDEKDKKSTELLNQEKEKEERHGERVIEDITSGDFDQPIDDQEVIPPTPEVFGEEEQYQPQNIIEEGEIVEPMQLPPGEPDNDQNEINPIRTPCPNPTDTNQVVIQPVFNPSGRPVFKSTDVKKPSNTQVVASKILKKYKNPKLLSRKKLPPQIVQKIVQQPRQIVQEKIQPQIQPPTKIISPKKPNACPICMKVFPRPWNLARHVGSVHKNLGSIKDILEGKVMNPIHQAKLRRPRVGFKFVRDVDVPMIHNINDEDKDKFSNWIEPGKRKSDEAKLPVKPPTRRIKKDNIRPTEEPQDEFENWN